MTTGTVGRQSSSGGVYANGGTNSALPGASPAAGTVAAGKTGRVGTGLAAGMAPGKTDRLAASPDPARFGGTTPTPSLDSLRTGPKDVARFGDTNPAAPAKGRAGLASALKTQQLPGNYGQDFAPQVRAANKISDDRLAAWDGALSSIRAAEAQKAPNPKTGKADPYNGLVGSKKGKKAPTHADLTNMTIAEVMSYQKGMLKAGHISTAVGAYQFMADTLPEVAAQAGMDINKTKFTAATQDQLARTLADDKRATQAARTKAGLTPETYARALAQEWAGLAVEDGRSYYAGDGLNKATVSYGETLAAARNLVNSGAVGEARLAGTAPGVVTVSGGVAAPGKTDRVASVPSPTARPTTGSVPTPAARPATPQRFGEKYLGNVPTPTARPEVATTKATRTLPDKVLAGAIDIGVGMVPGIGTAAGLYGLAAPLLGLPSIGDMALNLRDMNEFDLQASLSGKAPGRGTEGERLDGSVPLIKPTEETAAPAPAPAAAAATSFASKYLGFQDDTPRPTPAQKWGSSGANSVAYTL